MQPEPRIPFREVGEDSNDLVFTLGQRSPQCGITILGVGFAVIKLLLLGIHLTWSDTIAV